MKNAYLPKISILLQFGGEILALLCPGDSTNPSNFAPVPNIKNWDKIEGFVWSHHGITELISLNLNLFEITRASQSIFQKPSKVLLNSFPNIIADLFSVPKTTFLSIRKY